MRKTILGIVSALLLAFPVCSSAQQQESSLAEAARKAREQKKIAPKSTKVFTNDNLPTTPGGVSVVGTAALPEKLEKPKEGEKGAETAAEKPAEQKEEKGEAYWRARFTEARGKLHRAEKELDILQRELNLMEMQYYSDPNTALREQFNRNEINDRRKKIEEKRNEVQQLRQALADLEDELRQAGGPAAWARER